MISEQILQEWASAPTATKYKYTHEQVRSALEKYLPNQALLNNTEISTADFEIYLQGSYANSTNIADDSDVDIVVELKNILFSYDIDNLTDSERGTFHSFYNKTSSYSFENFKKDIYFSLNTYFDEQIDFAPKCLKIPKNLIRVNADVVPCFEHRKYERFTFYTIDKLVPGIKFYNTETKHKIINFPKKHLDNCKAKNIDTEGKFKDSIRIFKNINKKLNEENFSNNKTPSYFIENLIYNCSSQVFNGTYSDIILKIFQYVTNDIENKRFSFYQCANEQNLLFEGPNSWDETEAKNFIFKAGKLFLQKP